MKFYLPATGKGNQLYFWGVTQRKTAAALLLGLVIEILENIPLDCYLFDIKLEKK